MTISLINAMQAKHQLLFMSHFTSISIKNAGLFTKAFNFLTPSVIHTKNFPSSVPLGKKKDAVVTKINVVDSFYIDILHSQLNFKAQVPALMQHVFRYFLFCLPFFPLIMALPSLFWSFQGSDWTEQRLLKRRNHIH